MTCTWPQAGVLALRAIGAAAALVSSAVHFWEWRFNAFDVLPVIGPAFLVNIIAGVAVAVLLLLWRHWVPLLLLFGFGVLTLAAFVTSTTAGLFGVHEQWSGFPIWAAAVAEALAIIIGPLAWALERSSGGAGRPGTS